MSDRSKRYPRELRDRAVRMVFEHQGEYPSQWKAICSIGEQLGVHHESLRVWVRRARSMKVVARDSRPMSALG